MNNNIIITFEDGRKKEYKKGIKLKEILNDVKDNYETDIIYVKFKNRIINREDQITQSGNMSIFDLSTIQGNKVYERGLLLLFETYAHQVLGADTKIKIRQPVGKGVYFEIDKKVSEKQLQEIKDIMKQKVKENIPIEKIETTRMEAIEYFKSTKRMDKVKTLSYTTASFVKLYKIEGNYNYMLGDMPQSTGIFKYFDLTPIENGIIVRFPFMYDKGKIAKYVHHEQVFKIMKEYSNWGKLLNITNIGELNESVINRGAREIINLSEIVQDRNLFSIAEKIAKDNGERVILTFDGEKPFLLVEETANVEKDFSIVPIFGEPSFLNDTVGAITDNSLSWTSGGIDYYIVSDVMGKTELIEIANSISAIPIMK